MALPKGGRGKTVPYEQKHVRVPLPVLPQVKSICDSYRASVMSDELPDSGELTQSQIELSIELVKQFIKEEQIPQESINKPTRNNQNLKRFMMWLERKIE